MVEDGVFGRHARGEVRAEMVRQIQRLGRATPDAWERAVFGALTGGTREDVDWNVEENRAGYHAWVRSFDALIAELVEGGYVRREVEGGKPVLVAEKIDPALFWPPDSAD
jgi:hypothetical protein